MATPQTTETITQEFFGAVQIEVSDDGITYLDMGAVAPGTVFTENLVVSTVENENAEDRDLVTDQTGTLELQQIEIFDEDALDIIRGSLDVTENIAGTIVSSAAQVVASGAWNYNKFILIENQNGDGSIIVVNSLTGGTDGALVEDTDFYVGRNDAGAYGVFIIDSVTVTTEAQSMTFDYDYTPNATTRRHSGGLTDLDVFFVRLTNLETISGTARTVQWVFFQCTLTVGTVLEFKKYNDEDTRVVNPMTFNIRQDLTKTVGKRLYYRDLTPPL